jgi:multidrug resistance efflux pump
MTWTNRFRLWLSILLSLVLIFLLILVFNQRQHTIQSSSATIIAPRVQVASNYGGIVVKQYVTVGQKVKLGDVLFDVSSVSLQQDLANRVKVASSDALTIDAAKGVLTYKATTTGTVTQVYAQEGSYLSATQPLAVITGDTAGSWRRSSSSRHGSTHWWTRVPRSRCGCLTTRPSRVSWTAPSWPPSRVRRS